MPVGEEQCGRYCAVVSFEVDSVMLKLITKGGKGMPTKIFGLSHWRMRDKHRQAEGWGANCMVPRVRAVRRTKSEQTAAEEGEKEKCWGAATEGRGTASQSKGKGAQAATGEWRRSRDLAENG